MLPESLLLIGQDSYLDPCSRNGQVTGSPPRSHQGATKEPPRSHQGATKVELACGVDRLVDTRVFRVASENIASFELLVRLVYALDGQDTNWGGVVLWQRDSVAYCGG